MIVQARPVTCEDAAPAGELTWTLPNDPRDIDHLARWCGTVGPVVIASRVDPATAPVADGFVVVSWNVHVGGGDVEKVVDRLRRGEFTDGVPAPHFALLLQEAYREGADVPPVAAGKQTVPSPIVEYAPDGTRRDIRTVAERTGLDLFYAPSMRNGRLADPEDRGTAILSTVPLTDLQVIELPFERQRRVALAATIAGVTTAGAPWRLRIAAVQFDTSLALTRGGPLAARKRQAEALVEALTVAEPNVMTPTIVGGDFNTWLGPTEPALDVMRRTFSDTPLPAEAGSMRTASTWRGPLGTRAALDYVFVRGIPHPTGTHRLPDRYGSDHYPLLTRLSF